MKHLALIPAALLLGCGAAEAGATAWQQVVPGVELRLISSDTRAADGTTMAALEIDMPQGTKTYWKVPGESGIPTEIETAGSPGITAGRTLWPLPRIDAEGGVVDFVYFGPTVLPLELKLAQGTGGARLDARVTMGICSDICMPVTARLSLPLDFARTDHAQGLRIAQAIAGVPIAWDGDADPIGAVDFDAATGMLSVAVTDDRVDPGTIVADAGLGGGFFGAPQKRPDAQVVDLPLLGGERGAGLDGRKVILGFMTDTGPYSVARTIGSAGSTPPDRCFKVC
jgi:DsbC/DsbD-like thiol-disulfide interchange protein